MENHIEDFNEYKSELIKKLRASVIAQPNKSSIQHDQFAADLQLALKSQCDGRHFLAKAFEKKDAQYIEANKGKISYAFLLKDATPSYFYFVNPLSETEKNASLLFAKIYLINCFEKELSVINKFYETIKSAVSYDELQKFTFPEETYKKFLAFLIASLGRKENPQFNHSQWNHDFKLDAHQITASDFKHPFGNFYYDRMNTLKNIYKIPIDDNNKFLRYLKSTQKSVQALHQEALNKLKQLVPYPTPAITGQMATLTYNAPPSPPRTTPAPSPLELVLTLENIEKTNSYFRNDNQNNSFYLGQALLHAHRLLGIEKLKGSACEKKIKLQTLKPTEKFIKGVALLQLLLELSRIKNDSDRMKAVINLKKRFYEYQGKSILLFSHRHKWRRWVGWTGPCTTEKTLQSLVNTTREPH